MNSGRNFHWTLAVCGVVIACLSSCHSSLTGPVITATAPHVTANASCVRIGDTLRISGQAFDTIATRDSVLFPDTSGKRIAVAAFAVRLAQAADTVLVRVPQGAGSGRLIVYVGARRDTVATATTVDTLPIPTIFSFYPTSGSTGTMVTVRGIGIAANGSATVTIGGIAALAVSACYDSIVVRALGGSGSVVVHQGCSSVASPSIFAFVSRTLSITRFGPQWGRAIATIDTIDGTGFGADTSIVHVLFGGAEAKVLSLTPTRIIVQVPAAAKTGPIWIRVFSDSVVSTSNFRVASAWEFSTLMFTSYHVPALVSTTGNPPTAADTISKVYLSFPSRPHLSIASGTVNVADTLSFRSSVQVGPSADNVATIYIRCLVDSIAQVVRWLGMNFSENCNGCNDPHESQGTNQSLELLSMPLTVSADGSLVGELDGGAAVANVTACTHSSGWSARGNFSSTVLQKLLPAEDSTYFRVVLR